MRKIASSSGSITANFSTLGAMFVHLSHTLDVKGPSYPGSPGLAIEHNSVLGEDGDSNDYITHLPNHFGTHMDAPRHFVPDGLSFADLPEERFNFDGDEILLLDIPEKGKPKSVVEIADVEPYLEDFTGIRLLLLRTGFERYRNENPELYANEGPCLHPDLCKWLATETRVDCVGMDWISVGAPWNDMGTEAHRQLLGYYRDNFVTAIEDLSLAPVGDAWIDFITLGGLRIRGIDSSQVSVTAFLNDMDFLEEDYRDEAFRDAEAEGYEDEMLRREAEARRREEDTAGFDKVIESPDAPAPRAEDEP